MTSSSKRNTPVMGTEAVLFKRNNCVKSDHDDSKIIAELVCEKFLGFSYVTDLENTEYATCLSKDIKLEKTAEDIPEIIISAIDDAHCTECAEKNETTNEELEYDAEEFLRRALGDELCAYGLSESDDTKINCSHSNDSTSIGTSRISSLVNSLYNSFTRHIGSRPSTFTSSPLSHKGKDGDDSTDFCSLDTTAGMLIQEAAIQHQIIVETSKALNVCLSSKAFIMGPERIEAEKILLLAVYKREIIFKELPRLQYESMESLKCDSYGKVTISNIVFPPSADVNLLSQKEPNRWFTAIISCGVKVMAADVIMANDNGELRFQQNFEFDNLMPDFEIFVRLYSLSSAKNNQQPCNQDLTLRPKQNTVKCPNLPRFFHKQCKKTLRMYYSYERRDPMFQQWGSAVLHKTDLNNKISGFELDHVPRNAALRGVVFMDISSNVRFIKVHSGFLTIKSESDKYATWNRRWCYLNGYTLNYWNYPADQDLQIPIGTIDLRYCVSTTISSATREICPRSKTLLLDTVQTGTSSTAFVTRHYLSADSLQDMSVWEKHLNSVLSSLRCWNMMKCQVYVADTSTEF